MFSTFFSSTFLTVTRFLLFHSRYSLVGSVFDRKDALSSRICSTSFFVSFTSFSRFSSIQFRLKESTLVLNFVEKSMLWIRIKWNCRKFYFNFFNIICASIFESKYGKSEMSGIVERRCCIGLGNWTCIRCP